MPKLSILITKLADHVSAAIGTPWGFLSAFFFVVLWGVSGPLFNYSIMWQMVVNTTTNVVTFLMVFLIEHSQNKDTKLSQEDFEDIKNLLKQNRNGRS